MSLNAAATAQTAAFASKAPPEVVAAIQRASDRTGVNFSYLMAQAAQESSFDPKAQASTSSARGLYQFIDRTWLEMVRDHGTRHGIGDLSAWIEGKPGETPKVRDPVIKAKIMALRDDPVFSSMMAGEYASGNKTKLERETGGSAGATELYMAHFLGPSGASRFLTALKSNSAAQADLILPEAAAANRNVFYAKDSGRALSVGEIYQRFARSISGKQAEFGNMQALVQPLPTARDSTMGAGGSRVTTAGWNGPPGGLVAPETVMIMSKMTETLNDFGKPDTAAQQADASERSKKRQRQALANDNLA